MTSTEAREAQSLERRLERLEELVDRLERENLELDDALRLFEEGIGHVREVREALRSRELVVERLIDEAASAFDAGVVDARIPTVPAGDPGAAATGEED